MMVIIPTKVLISLTDIYIAQQLSFRARIRVGLWGIFVIYIVFSLTHIPCSTFAFANGCLSFHWCCVVVGCRVDSFWSNYTNHTWQLWTTQVRVLVCRSSILSNRVTYIKISKEKSLPADCCWPENGTRSKCGGIAAGKVRGEGEYEKV